MNNPKLKLDILCSKSVSISLYGSFFVGESQRSLSGDWIIRPDQNNIIIENDDEIIVISNSVVFVPMNWEECYFILNNVREGQENQNFYKGAIHLSLVDDRVKVDNEVDIDFFINSVLDRRYAGNDQLEFLKTQVVLLRSYLLKYKDEINSMHLLKHKSDNAILLHKYNFIEPKPKQLHFLYLGCSLSNNDLVNKAVDQTKGMAIFHNSKVVTLPITYCCGGITGSSYYFGEELSDFYLKNISDSLENKTHYLKNEQDFCEWLFNPGSCFCKGNSEGLLSKIISVDIGNRDALFRWNKVLSAEDVVVIVNSLTNSTFKSIDDVIVVERQNDGNIKQLAIHEGDMSIVLQDMDLLLFSAFLGLQSTTYVVKKSDKKSDASDEFVVNGVGKGHRAGLCLLGAMAMSEKGFNMEEIIKHYFKDVYISKQY